MVGSVLAETEQSQQSADTGRQGLSTRALAIGLVVLAVLLMAVKAYGVVYDEVYPAVTFPGFARIPEGAATNVEDVRVQIVTIRTVDDSYDLTAAETFPEPFDSFYLPMLESLASAQDSEGLRSWAETRLNDHTGLDECVVGLQVVEVRVTDDTDRTVLNNIDFPPCTESAEASS